VVSTSEGLKISHGLQKFLIVSVAPHQHGNMQGRRPNHANWPTVDLLAAFLRVQSIEIALKIFPGTFW